MKRFTLFLIAALLLMPSLSFAETAEEQRAAIKKMEAETLAELYKVQPDAQREIAAAKGYAVFTSGELAIVWFSGGYGHGVVHSNETGRDTYMQMAKAGVGLGLGAKDFKTVFVFHSSKSMHHFITQGLDMTGTADAAAKAGAKGESFSGAADVLPNTRIYQLTDTGLMAQAMLQGTKYWQDKRLNNTNPPKAAMPADPYNQ